MFNKQFELLERAVSRISDQLKTADSQQKIYLAEELFTLRKACDSFLEKWIDFEDHVSELVELYRLDSTEQDPSAPLANTLKQTHATNGLQNTTLSKTDKKLGMKEANSSNASDGSIANVGESETLPIWKTLDSRTIGNQKPSVAIQLKPYELLTSSLQVRSFEKGLGFFQLLMFPEAIYEFEQVVAGNGQHLTLARLYLGISCLMQDRYTDARQHFKLLEHLTNDTRILAAVYQARGILDFQEEDFQGAIRYFQKAEELTPNRKDLIYNLGICYARLGKYVQALQQFVRCYREDPLDVEAGVLAAKIWRLLGYGEEALVYVNELSHTFPNHLEIASLQADLLLEMGDIEHARLTYQKLVDTHPGYGRGFSGLGWVTLMQGDLMRARAYFIKHLSLEPGSIEAKFHMSWVLSLQNELEQAERLLLEILKSSPGDPYACIGLADLYGRLGQHPSARDLLHRVAKNKNPHVKRIALVHLGKLSIELKRYDESLRYLNAALRFDNQSVETLFYKGLTYYLLGDHTSAEEYWQRCGERAPYILAQ